MAAAEFSSTSALKDLERLNPWLEEVGTAAGVPAWLLNRIQVVAEEVVLNIARHAYVGPVPGPVVVVLDPSPDLVLLMVKDAGPYFDPTEALAKPPGADRVGGWGLGLMRTFCPDTVYHRMGEWNVLKMAFRVE